MRRWVAAALWQSEGLASGDGIGGDARQELRDVGNRPQGRRVAATLVQDGSAKGSAPPREQVGYFGSCASVPTRVDINIIGAQQ